MIPRHDNLPTLALDDLHSLIRDQVRESKQLDFKREPWSGANWSKEWCKDISALANTEGGAIVLGIREEDAVAVELVGCEGEIDELKRRLNQSVEAGVSPRLQVDFREFPLPTGRWAMVIATPPSRFGPHMNSAAGDNRFHKRTSTNTEVMDVDELRRAFTTHRSVQDIAAERHQARTRRIGSSPNYLTVVLDCFALPLDVDRLDPARASIDAVLHNVRPFGGGSYERRVDFNGYVMTGIPSDEFSLEAQRSGTILTHFRIGDLGRENARHIATIAFPRQLRDGVKIIEQCFQNIRFSGPYLAVMTLKGALGRRLTDDYSHSISQDVLEFPPLLVDRLGPEPLETLAPWMHRLWNAAGLERCGLYSADNRLIPNVLR